MMTASLALFAALSAQAAAAQAPASGTPAAPAAAAQPERQYNLSRQERVAIAPLLAAYGTANAAGPAAGAAAWAPVQALLPAAQAAAQGNDAKYLVARILLTIGLRTPDTAVQISALDALIASPSTLPDELPRFLNARAELAFAAQDFAGAEAAYQRLLTLTPGDQRVIGNLATVRSRMGNTAGAMEAVLQNIAAQEAANGFAEEALYRRARDTAYRARDRSAIDLATRLARHYPTPANWRDAISLFRESAGPAPEITLDTLRLMRAVRGLEGGTNYLVFAQLLDQSVLPGETKAVLDEAIARGALRAADPSVSQLMASANRRIVEDRRSLPGEIARARSAPQGRLARSLGDALYGYGRYGEAADLYRAAMTKTGEDRNLLGLRLGAALAMAGQRAEAETALRAVTGQPGELAKLWMAWLARRAG